MNKRQHKENIIEHSKPTIGKEERDAVLRVLKTSFLAEGQQVKQFEDEICSYIGAKGAVATSTGTLALHLALLSLGVGKNDHVIAPSYVCRSVLNAILYCGARPVLCDVNREDHNISFLLAKKKISGRTKAIIVAHMFGCPAEIDRFKTLGVPIIEDCAHSIGAEYRGRKVGSWGDLSIFSFEGTKYIVTGEGGMVVSNSSRLLKSLKALKKPESFDYKRKFTYRMTDLQAAIGRVQLSKLEYFIRKRNVIVSKYNDAFSCLDMELPQVASHGRHVFHRYMVKIKQDIHSFMKRCEKAGVKVKQPVKPYPLHRYLGFSDKNFPATSSIMKSAISVPIYPLLKTQQITHIIKTVRQLINGYNN